MTQKFGWFVIVLMVVFGWETGFLSKSYFSPNKILAQDIAVPTPTIVSGIPQTVVIPSLAIRAAVESVGVVDNVRMDVPKTPSDVAWYNGGAKPGEVGNVAIDGHFDTETGAPAIFYNLKDIKIGDPVQVIDDQNRIYVYKVIAVNSYTDSGFPFGTVFGMGNKPLLYLITCDGIWNRQEQNYSKRAVVTAELQ